MNDLEKNNALIERLYIEKDEMQSRIAELSKPILCAKCSDHIVAGEQGAICEVCASTQESAITELQKENAELKSFLCLGEKLDFLLEAYGLSDEPMTKKALEIKAWMQKNVIEPKAEVDSLRKAAIEWHRYPDEKPLIDGRYLFWDSDGNAPHVLPHNDIVVRDNPGVFSTQTHWAYLPAPPEEGEK